jgi:hypothetical protein
MNKNMGTLDRVIRIVLAAVAVLLVLTKVVSGALLTVLVVVAAVLLLTSILGFCPVYIPLRVSTRRK